MAEFLEALKNSFNDTFGETINIGSGSILTLNLIVWSLFIGFLIGIGATVYNKVVLGPFVRSLMDKNVTSEDKALPLKELSHTSIFLRFALRRGSSLRRVVRACGDTEAEDSTVTLSDAKFYIPEENFHRAEKIYGSLGTSIPAILLSVLAFFLITLAALIVVPDLTQLVVNFVSGI